MTAIELKNYFRSTLTARRTITQEYSALDAIVDFISQSLSTGIPEWTNVLAFNNNGSGAGAFTTYPATTGALRFWNSKTNGNTGNQPPTDPLVTENTYWKEVSPSDGSSIKEWAAGIYLSGLQIVFHRHSTDGPEFYVLNEAIRPFTSTDIEAEIVTGKWNAISDSAALGYTPENVANKATTLAGFNDTKYPTTKLLNDQLALKIDLSRAAYSIIGNATNASANATDIAAADGQILRRKGSTFGFGNNGLNALLFNNNQGIDSDTAGDTLSIGGTNAAIVNIGRAGQTVNILGSVLSWQATNSYVNDQLITLNRGGGAATAVGAGLEIEEASSITAFIKTNASRNGYLFKAPSISSTADFLFSSLTANRQFTLPDATGTFALTSDISSLWNLSSGGAITANNTISGAFNIGFTNTALGVGVAPASIAANTKLEVRGADALSTSFAFRASNNSGTSLLLVSNDGKLQFGSNASRPFIGAAVSNAFDNTGANLIFQSASNSIGFTFNLPSMTANSQNGIRLQGTFTNSSTSPTVLFVALPSISHTGSGDVTGYSAQSSLSLNSYTGIYKGFRNQSNFNPNASTAGYRGFTNDFDISTSGGYVGTLIGYDHSPTLTSVTGLTHLAWRNTSGDVLIGGTTITTGNVLVDLQSTSRALLLTRVATEGNITVPVNGMTYYNSTNNRFRCYVNGAWRDSLTGAVATGWALPTGTLDRTTFDQSTVTLPQLAQRLAALITDLRNTVTVLAA